jgi:hypothetical protein
MIRKKIHAFLKRAGDVYTTHCGEEIGYSSLDHTYNSLEGYLGWLNHYPEYIKNYDLCLTCYDKALEDTYKNEKSSCS